MSQPNKRVVQRRSDGDYEVRKPGADRASAIAETQAQAIDRAREILSRRRRRAGGSVQQALNS